MAAPPSGDGRRGKFRKLATVSQIDLVGVAGDADPQAPAQSESSISKKSHPASCVQVPTVVNVRKENLTKRGYSDFKHWVDATPAHVYIGRNMSFYVKGTINSKWRNPYTVKKLGRDQCLARYRERIVNGVDEKGRTNTLRHELGELSGKELGCWCHPEPCHGHVLADLVKEFLMSP